MKERNSRLQKSQLHQFSLSPYSNIDQNFPKPGVTDMMLTNYFPRLRVIGYVDPFPPQVWH